MILFINNYITEEKYQNYGSLDRANAKKSDKLDIYKYMLASLSNFYPWKRVIINTKLDDFYSARRQELNEFIEKEFGKYDLLIRNFRREKQAEWQEEYEYFNDNLIMYIGNHDHIFIDSDLDYIHNVINNFSNDDKYQSIQFSHFPELVTYPFCPTEPLGNIEIAYDHFSYEIDNVAALQIINKNVYKYWWFEHKFDPDTIFGRSDMFPPTMPINCHAKFKRLKWINIYKEVARHFDGYSHCHFDFVKHCPVLEIPEGFWDNNIKINYSTKYKEGMTNINPLSDKLKIFDESGTDLNISKKYIPHFWKPRISEFIDDFKNLSSIWTEEELDEVYINRMMEMWQWIPATNGIEVKNELMKRLKFWNQNIKPFSLN